MVDEIKAQPATAPFGWMKLNPEHKEKVFQLFGDLSEYFRLLRKETDRGCAMIVAANLDDKLGELLKASMVQDKEYEEEISEFFKGTQPLGSFSARIKLSHYLNIISPQVRRDLDIIRKIRNDFGHKLEFEDFNTPSIKERCMNLQHDLLEENKNPRERFINAANVLIVFIDFFRDNAPGFGLALNPRNVEIALMQDIQNAAALVHRSKE
jgi:DNA-binding MltR family transcriptional regulator